MDLFKNPADSHNHSLSILNYLYVYDDFMDSLEVVADMGCGSGLDIRWWATRETRDDPPEPHNYLCYAVDSKPDILEPEVAEIPNVVSIVGNFETRVIPRQVDLMWSHNTFQYAINPMATLRVWNETMNYNGMLILTVPMYQRYQYNRLKTVAANGCYYSYNICNLMYMLAVNGFDCRDCYFDMQENSPWISAAVYKSPHAPLDPATTTWHDLVDLNLVNDSVAISLNKYGYVAQEELLFTWLNKDWRWAKN